MPDLFGYLAAACVLTAAGVERLDWLRYASFLSNVLFITYAALAGMVPVLILHSMLLPINAFKCYRHLRRAHSRSRRTL